MKHLLILIALAASAQQIKINPFTGLPDLTGGSSGGSCTAGAGITCVGATISVDTAVIESRATAQAGTSTYCRSTTGNDTYTCSLTPTLTAYTTGSCLVLNPDTANTTTATLNVDALGAVSILGPFGSALATGDIPAGPSQVCYNGTAFIKQGFSYLVLGATSTNFVLRNGSAQSGSLQEWQNSGGSVEARVFNGYSQFVGAIWGGGAGYASIGYYSAPFALGSNITLAWTNTSGDSSATQDSGLGRNAAGIVEVNNGTLGTLRDLIQRHPLAGGTSPTITSGFGTTPSIAGKDAAGRVTVGTGGTAATGTVTFGTAWATAPACTASNQSTELVAFTVPTTTTLVIKSTTPFTAGDVLQFVCVGY